MTLGVSLANKCQLLFGAAIVLIIAATLLVPWLLLGRISDRTQFEAARHIADLWERLPSTEATLDGPIGTDGETPGDEGAERPTLRVRHLPGERLAEAAEAEGFLGASARRFLGSERATEHTEALRIGGRRTHQYARAVRDESGAVERVILIEHGSSAPVGRLFIDRLYLLSAGFFAGGLAVLAFYLITTRLILSPVRELTETAERVRQGSLDIRADIHTGDEFEELGQAFNRMLEDLAAGQEQLRGINASLDLRINELSETNLALYEAARLKGDFLASVSHELRTPLNSIIGFAELLEEIAATERPGGAPIVIDEAQYTKRRRYISNIVAAGRSLLEMINELLDMAKIEAGKVDLHVEPMNVAEACEGLLALIRPQADRKKLRLSLEIPRPAGGDGPGPGSAPGAGNDGRATIIQTDHRKFQQIVFNFLSNAVKFTPDGGAVTLRAERLMGGDARPRVRVSVLDTGPGIAPVDQERIFEKFVQLEAGHTRQHAGTGLGLAICRELSAMIQGEIQLVSDVGRGSMFSLIVPLAMDPDKAAEMTLRMAGRGAGPARVGAD